MVMTDIIIKGITKLGAKYKAEKILLYGARTHENCSPKSDYQIAVWGIENDKKYLFNYEIRELPTLLNINVTHMSDKISDALKEQIEHEGVAIYENKD